MLIINFNLQNKMIMVNLTSKQKWFLTLYNDLYFLFLTSIIICHGINLNNEEDNFPPEPQNKITIDFSERE